MFQLVMKPSSGIPITQTKKKKILLLYHTKAWRRLDDELKHVTNRINILVLRDWITVFTVILYTNKDESYQD